MVELRRLRASTKSPLNETFFSEYVSECLRKSDACVDKIEVVDESLSSTEGLRILRERSVSSAMDEGLRYECSDGWCCIAVNDMGPM